MVSMSETTDHLRRSIERDVMNNGVSTVMSLSSPGASATPAFDVATDRGTAPQRRVLISIPSGFQLRQFVHSGVVNLLLEQGFQVLVVSPNAVGEGFAGQIQERGVEVFALN